MAGDQRFERIIRERLKTYRAEKGTSGDLEQEIVIRELQSILDEYDMYDEKDYR